MTKSFSRSLGKRRAMYSHKTFGSIGGVTFRPMMNEKCINVCEDILHDGKTDDIDALANANMDGYVVKREDGSLFVTVPAMTMEQTERFNGIVEE